MNVKGLLTGFIKVSNKHLYTKPVKKDQKDSDYNIPEPPTHHDIVCKKCGKKETVSLKYTRMCKRCRDYYISGCGKNFFDHVSWDLKIKEKSKSEKK